MSQDADSPGVINELDKSRLDIAWKWFDFHGKQRMTLFNFFLLTTGIVLNAYVVAYKEGMSVMAIIICVFGVFQCLAFMSLDIRSRELTTHGEHVIEMVERSVLFPADYLHESINKGKKLGLLTVERRTWHARR